MPAAPAVPAVPPDALVVRLRNFVGDVVLSVPTLRRLSEAGCALHLIGKVWAKPLLAGFGWPVHTLAGDLPGRIGQWRRLRHDLRAPEVCTPPRRPDSIVFPYSFGSALEARLAGWRPLGFAYEGRPWLLGRAPPKLFVSRGTRRSLGNRPRDKLRARASSRCG